MGRRQHGRQDHGIALDGVWEISADELPDAEGQNQKSDVDGNQSREALVGEFHEQIEENRADKQSVEEPNQAQGKGDLIDDAACLREADHPRKRIGHQDIKDGIADRMERRSRIIVVEREFHRRDHNGRNDECRDKRYQKLLGAPSDILFEGPAIIRVVVAGVEEERDHQKREKHDEDVERRQRIGPIGERQYISVEKHNGDNHYALGDVLGSGSSFLYSHIFHLNAFRKNNGPLVGVWNKLELALLLFFQKLLAVNGCPRPAVPFHALQGDVRFLEESIISLLLHGDKSYHFL